MSLLLAQTRSALVYGHLSTSQYQQSNIGNGATPGLKIQRKPSIAIDYIETTPRSSSAAITPQTIVQIWLRYSHGSMLHSDIFICWLVLYTISSLKPANKATVSSKSRCQQPLHRPSYHTSGPTWPRPSAYIRIHWRVLHIFLAFFRHSLTLYKVGTRSIAPLINCRSYF